MYSNATTLDELKIASFQYFWTLEKARESSDIILKNIILPKQTSGNYLIIKDVGAYGSVMASNYNSRGLPVEILVCNSNLAVIHKPLNIQEIIDQDNIPSWL